MASDQPRAAVITGASSGIGRATAVRLAKEGYGLALAARRGEALEATAALCERQGARCLVLPTDVSDAEEVFDLGDRAFDEFGRVDLWVNDAALFGAGRFEDLPLEAFEQIVHTDLMGYVYGARVALALFRQQGAGVLVNVASLESRLAAPYFSAYAAAKHAVLGWSRSLQSELALEGNRSIRVCVVMPATIDTPIFQQSPNYTGRPVVPVPPLYPPERVARAIARLARKPKDAVYVGASARILSVLTALAPGPTHRAFARLVHRRHFDSSQPAPVTPGNLEPTEDLGHTSGGWRALRRRRLAVPLLASATMLAGLLLARGGRAHAV